MATIVEFEVKGLSRMRARLKDIARQSRIAIPSAMQVEGEIELTEMKQRTPVDTGALRASGRVNTDGEMLDSWKTVWTFGSAAVDYAAIVHEDLSAFHPVGDAKYVESVLVESRPFLVERIARRAMRTLGAA